MHSTKQSSVPRERRLLVLANKAAQISPGQRYRFEQWTPLLEREHKIRVDLQAFESPELTEILYADGHLLSKSRLVAYDFVRRARALLTANSYDAILIFREAALIGPAFYERLLAATRKPIIFDFDDAIWSPGQAWKNGVFSRLHFPGKTSTICRIATAVTVGNDYLAAYARKRNDDVSIVPSSIELADYPVVPESTNKEKFVVCWSGSTSTLVHFEHARPALEKLATLLPLVVKIICSQPPARPIAGAEMSFVRWSAENEARDVGDCHVGIMPLPDDEVSRGKCAMKALQYMATGRPVVVSPVGVNAQIVQDGHNGFLAQSNEQWVATLRQLAGDADLRARLGGKARETVEQGFTAEISAAKFAAVVKRVCR